MRSIRRRSLTFFIISCFFIFKSFGQVIFKNSGSNKIFVAYVAFQSGSWTSVGWFPIAAGEQKSVYNYSLLSNRNFYYCAKIENSDQGYYGDVAFYANNVDAFQISYADKQQSFNDANIIPLKFIAVNLGGQKSYTIELAPHNLTLNGLSEGNWRIALDKEWDAALKTEDAEGYREITFSQGRPMGWCKDYFADGYIRASYKLLSYQPFVLDGKCTWYKKDGSVEKEVVYQNGQPSTAVSYNSNGEARQKHAMYKVVTMPVRDFVVNSTSNERFKGGHSRVPYVINLPAGTVKWFYEFSATRNTEDLANNKANFKLAANMSKLVDQSGVLAASVNLLGSPPGSNYCDVYVMDGSSYDNFITGKNWNYQSSVSQLNMRSGVMEVSSGLVKNPIIGISNRDGFYGINVSIQVVAIVAEMD